MFGIGLAYFLRHPLRTIVFVASNPLEALAALRDAEAEEREEPPPSDLYHPVKHWERRLHQLLGIEWPCEVIAESQALWTEVIAELQTKGVHVGPQSYHYWNDGDAGLLRAIWCLIRHLRPCRVVETGVAHGLTSRFILEGLDINGAGHLWSIDREPMDRALGREIGLAVGNRFSHRWSYIEGSSRRQLPKLLSRIGEIDIFIHDSLHTEHNVRFELDHAWAALRKGGAIVVDDIDLNRAFRSFTQTFSGHQSLVCEAEPIRPDFRRFNKKGLFGIILKHPT
jgi:predicted O-methyltransferase YrrM